MLAKFVFVSLKYKGWVGLSEHALHEKAEPYKFAVREVPAILEKLLETGGGTEEPQ